MKNLSRPSIAIQLPDVTAYPEVKDLNLLAKVVLGKLIQLSDWGNSKCCLRGWLSKKIGVSPAGVSKAIRELEDRGFIVVNRSHGKKSSYTLNLEKFPDITYQGAAESSQQSELVNQVDQSTGLTSQQSKPVNRVYHQWSTEFTTSGQQSLPVFKSDLSTVYNTDPTTAEGGGSDRSIYRSADPIAHTRAREETPPPSPEAEPQNQPAPADTRGRTIVLTLGGTKPPRMAPAPQSQNMPINTPPRGIVPSFDEVLAEMTQIANTEILPHHPYFSQHVDLGYTARKFLNHYAEEQLLRMNWVQKASEWVHREVAYRANVIDKPNEHGPQRPAFRNKRTPLTWEEHHDNAMENAQYILSQRGGDAEHKNLLTNQ